MSLAIGLDDELGDRLGIVSGGDLCILVRDLTVLADDELPTGDRRVPRDLDRLALGVLGFDLPAFTDRPVNYSSGAGQG